MQFPVSSGQQHRRTETEWVPVSPKKAETTAPATKPTESITLIQSSTTPTVQTTPAAAPGPQVFPPVNKLDVRDIFLTLIYII